MSIELTGALFWSGPKTLAARFLLCVLADYANDEGYCWPKVETIAEKCGITPRSVIRHLQTLEAEGWLSRETRVVERAQHLKGAGSKSNLYQLNVEKILAEGKPRARKAKFNVTDVSPRKSKNKVTAVSRSNSKNNVTEVSPSKSKFNVTAVAAKSDYNVTAVSPAYKEQPSVKNNRQKDTPLPPSSGGSEAKARPLSKSEAKRIAAQREARVGMYYRKITPPPAPAGAIGPPVGTVHFHPHASMAGEVYEGEKPLPYPGKHPEQQPDPPHLEPRVVGKVDAMAWTAFKLALKLAFGEIPPGLDARFTPLVAGQNDYDAAFRDMWLEDSEMEEAGKTKIIIAAAHPELTQAGFLKYRNRIADLMKKHFRFTPQVEVRAA